MYITVALIAIVAIVTLLIVGSKTNAAMVFLALCGGSVLVTLMGEDVSLLAKSLSSGNAVAPIAAQIGLLLLPVLLCVLFLKGSVSPSKMLFQLLPALATAIVGVLLVVPLLSSGAQKTLGDNFIWQQLQQFEPVVLLVGVFGSLLVAAVSSHHKKEEHHKKHH
jgi:hypothetical protein